jgi:hypothetical protein
MNCTGCGTNEACDPDGLCVCAPGYAHDRMYVRYSHCFMSVAARDTLLMLLFVISLVLAIWSVWNLRGGVRKFPRWMCISALATGVIQCILTLILFVNHGEATPASYFFLCVMCWLLCAIVHPFVLWTFMFPVLRSTMRSVRTTGIKRAFEVQVGLHAVLFFSTWLCLLFYDQEINWTVGAVFAYLSVYSAILSVLHRYWSYRLLYTVNAVTRPSTPTMQNYSETLFIVTGFMCVLIPMVSAAYICPLILYAMRGPWPHAYITFVVFCTSNVVLGGLSTFFSHRQHRFRRMSSKTALLIRT